MKYVVLLAVLVIAYMVWRSNRIERRGPPPGAPGAANATPQEMIACPVCGLHLPRADAVTDAKGLAYCSQEHRLLAGD
ncbi:PP0621 family protein [Ramlibacter sp. PS3R-8]|uniref:PP0621 family protein n=1 Tax=Ramlibacter sp. PS3R-8 TaxID=3133437 RepID=UPI0030979C85